MEITTALSTKVVGRDRGRNGSEHDLSVKECLPPPPTPLAAQHKNKYLSYLMGPQNRWEADSFPLREPEGRYSSPPFPGTEGVPVTVTQLLPESLNPEGVAQRSLALLGRVRGF